MSETSTRTRVTQIGTVILTVNDQDRAIEFYETKLGFEKRADAPFGDGQRWVEVGPPGGATTIALCLPMGGTQPGNNNPVALNTTDIESDHAELKARGVNVDAELMRGPDIPTMFWFSDLDGNRLLLVQSTQS